VALDSLFNFTVIGRGLGAASALTATDDAVAGVSARGSRDGLSDMGTDVKGSLLELDAGSGAVVRTGARADAGAGVSESQLDSGQGWRDMSQCHS
jgi:hypothetical protein